MFYYLETNALGFLKKDLSRIKNIEKCYTSIFAIHEQLRGIGEKSYHKKREIFLAINDSNLRIDKETENFKTLSALGVPSLDDSIPTLRKNILKIYQAIVSFPDYCSFMKHISLEDLPLTYNFLSNEKELHDIVFSQIRNHLKKPPLKMTNEEKDYELQLFINIPSQLIEMSLNLECSGVQQLFEIDPQYLYEHYNGSLDVYFFFFQVFIMNKLLYNEKMKVSDLYDLKNLKYVQNQGTAIVSNDKIYQLFKQTPYKNMVLTVDEFKTKMCI